MLMWSLLGVTLVLCAIAGFPTKWWHDMARWLRDTWHRRTVRGLEQALARQARGRQFTPETSFLGQGVGLALDPARRELFLAMRDGNGLAAGIFPYAAIRHVRRGEANDNGFHDYYVELTLRDAPRPVWRLLCGEDTGLAAKVAAAAEKAAA